MSPRQIIPCQKARLFNPIVTNELSHPYHLEESNFITRDIRTIFFFSFFILFFDEIYIKQTQQPRVGCCSVLRSPIWGYSICLSNKNDAMLLWVKAIKDALPDYLVATKDVLPDKL